MATLNILNQSRDNLLLSDDENLLEMQKIHTWLSIESYWARGRELEVLERAFTFSYPFGVYEDGNQIAVARIVSDTATFAWLCDLFVDSSYRGRGIGTWLTKAAIDWADANGVMRIILATKDAHEVYSRLGFQPLAEPNRWMAIDKRPQA